MIAIADLKVLACEICVGKDLIVACGRPNELTPADVRLGYQCDRCAEREEGVS